MNSEDLRTEADLQEMVWPNKCHAAVSRIVSRAPACLDILRRTAAGTDCMQAGSSFHARDALSRVVLALSSKCLTQLSEARSFDEQRVEAGALAIGNTRSFQDPANSMIHRVLSSRRGIPITLGLVHKAVASRAGLPVQMLGLPMRVFNSYTLAVETPVGTHTAAAAAAAAATALPPGQLFIDVFQGGQIIGVGELGMMLQQLGDGFDIDVILQHASFVMHNQSLHTRMLANLSQPSGPSGMESLATVLELAAAVSPGYLHEIRRTHASHSDLCMRRGVPGPAPDGLRVGAVVTVQGSGRRALICEAVTQHPPPAGNLDGCCFPPREVSCTVLLDIDELSAESDLRPVPVRSRDITLLALPVEHPEVGKQFEGLPEGERRYVLNAYMQHKYPTC
ncbi:MAG: hypothetical protein WDW38_009677 [Sanguina aurantia]